jgi:ABC-2 type transport system ATP-binding protein
VQARFGGTGRMQTRLEDNTIDYPLLVATLAERGKVIVYSSHVLDAVEKVCQSLVILRRGSPVASTSVVQLRELTEASSLEQAFATLAVDQDVVALGRELADIGTR